MEQILNQIDSPKDIKKLSIKQLNQLAQEIRQLLIQTISETGGHLAPNLGVVELTIALHRVFDSPHDKFVFDVGHQSYVHKILTGRRERFHSIRQYHGISGFPKRCESEHDVFGTGHSTTSISAALGIAAARDLQGDNYHVVALIGDGSLTGGMAYEAINNAGHLGTNLTVILNDNEMSIAKNVGAISEYLAKVRSAPGYAKIKQDIEVLLKRIPAIGDSVAKTVERVKDSLKYLVVPGVWFEELGFTYMGPIDGHNIPSLLEVLQQSRNIKGPVLIHAITTKGKGYEPAECHADKYHGVGPFCIESGKVTKNGNKPSYTQIFGDTLIELAKHKENLVAITAAMPEGTGLVQFSKKYPKRFFDVGIAECHAVTMAAGMATQGIKPVVAIYSTFLQRAYDLIVHDVALQKLPVIFAIDRGGVVGEDGPTHHGVFDFAYLRHIPNLTIMAPKDENELRHMLFTAYEQPGPVAIRYPRGAGTGVACDEKLKSLPIGQGERVKTGQDVTLVAIGSMVQTALEAAEMLKNYGLDAEVINARYVKPLDEKLLSFCAQKTKHLVTLEDHVTAGGFGSAVLEWLHRTGQKAEVLTLGYPDQFIEHGSRSQLLHHYGLDAAGVTEAVLQFMRKQERQGEAHA